jgi:hypothetical protein
MAKTCKQSSGYQEAVTFDPSRSRVGGISHLKSSNSEDSDMESALDSDADEELVD